MEPNTAPSDPMFARVDSLVRDGTLSAEQAGRVYARVREAGSETPAGATSVLAADTDTDTNRWTLPQRMSGGAAVLGAAVLLGALFVAGNLADQDDFNWKAFLVVFVGAVALCAVAAATALLGGDPDHRRWIATVVAATGIVALALVLDILLQGKDWSEYLTGALMVVAGVAAYLWLRESALTAVVVLGGLLVLTQIIEDVTDDQTATIGPQIALTVFGIVVAAAGWPLASRHVTGMLGGVIALGGMVLAVLFAGLFVLTLGVFRSGPLDAGPQSDVNGDLWTALAIGLLVCAGLAALYAYSEFIGYLVLAFLGAVALVVGSLLSLRTDIRLWLAVIIGAVGGLLAAGAALRELVARGSGTRRSTRRGSPPPGYGVPQGSPQPPPAYGTPPTMRPPPPGGPPPPT